MSKPIYQLFVGNNNIAGNLARKALSETERKALMNQEQASGEAVGAKAIVMCDSAWADEEHPWWGVLRFPDLQARIEHTCTLQKIGWLDITDSFTLLGTSDDEPHFPSFPNPIYQLWIAKADPVTMANRDRLSKGETDALWAKWQESVNRTGACMMLSCDSNWANEELPSFGIMAFPSIDARQEHVKDLEKLKWPLYITAFTVLGTVAARNRD